MYCIYLVFYTAQRRPGTKLAYNLSILEIAVNPGIPELIFLPLVNGVKIPGFD